MKMIKDYEVEGCWNATDYTESKCRVCGSKLELTPREGHYNSKYWSLERNDGNALKCCPQGCNVEDTKRPNDAIIEDEPCTLMDDMKAYMAKELQTVEMLDLDISPMQMRNEQMAEDYYWKMIEDNECKPVSVTENPGRWKSGYIDRVGNFYPCPMMRHMDLGEVMKNYGILSEDIEDTDKYLEKKGWLKMSVNRLYYLGKLKPTKKQLDTLYSYYEAKGVEKININGIKDIPYLNIEENLNE